MTASSVRRTTRESREEGSRFSKKKTLFMS